MPSKLVKVAMFQTARPIEIDAGATFGAIVGYSLTWPDGSVVTVEDLTAVAAAPPGDGTCYWRNIQEIPRNVNSLAAQTGVGLYVLRSDGSSATRSITVDSSELTLSNGSGESGNILLGLPEISPLVGGTLKRYGFDINGRRVLEGTATTDHLGEGITNLYFTNVRADARAAAAVATHVGLADPHAQYLLHTAVRGFIAGFAWRTTATSIIFEGGSAYVEAAGKIVSAAAQTIAGAIPANTWLHLYVNASGVISASATAPSAPYFGTARSVGGINGWRYLMSIRSNASSQLPLMRGEGAGNVVDVTLLSNIALETLVSSGASTTPVTLSTLGNYAPANVTTMAKVRFQHNGTDGVARIYASFDGSATYSIFINAPFPGTIYTVDVPVSAAPAFQYDVTTAGARATIALLGYRYAR